jgi:hypothetical protein
MTLVSIARGAVSGVEVTLRSHHVFTVRGGLIVRHVIGERDVVLREAGIEPP